MLGVDIANLVLSLQEIVMNVEVNKKHFVRNPQKKREIPQRVNKLSNKDLTMRTESSQPNVRII